MFARVETTTQHLILTPTIVELWEQYMLRGPKEAVAVVVDRSVVVIVVVSLKINLTVTVTVGGDAVVVVVVGEVTV